MQKNLSWIPLVGAVEQDQISEEHQRDKTLIESFAYVLGMSKKSNLFTECLIMLVFHLQEDS